jgi:hypothetical protein
VNFISSFLDKFYLKQWTVGLVSGSIDDIIRSRSAKFDVKWLRPPSPFVFYADPFILGISNKGEVELLVEELIDGEGYGKITKLSIAKDLSYSSHTILDLKAHLSYPQVFCLNGETFVVPESASLQKLNSYRLDEDGIRLELNGTLLDIGLYDATILYQGGKFWLFGILSKDKTPRLVIYHSDQFMGPYTQHKSGVIKSGRWGVRPAGKFIEVDGQLFRPAQNGQEYYGKSIIIFKVDELTQDSYKESFYMEIRPEQLGAYNFGIHTINNCNGILVVDGLRRHFKPFYKVKKAILDKL